MMKNIMWLLRHILRTTLYIALLVYIHFGVMSTVAVFKRIYYAQQDISILNNVIDEALAEKNPLLVASWLSARPPAETDVLIGKIVARSSVLEPGVFFEFYRRESKRGNAGEALFWLQLGRYRMRYDWLRCGSDMESNNALNRLLDVQRDPAIDRLLREKPEALKASIRRVLDFDAKHPAHNDPILACKVHANDMGAPEESWETYRRLLRHQTEEFLKSPDKAASGGKPAATKP